MVVCLVELLFKRLHRAFRFIGGGLIAEKCDDFGAIVLAVSIERHVKFMAGIVANFREEEKKCERTLPNLFIKLRLFAADVDGAIVLCTVNELKKQSATDKV